MMNTKSFIACLCMLSLSLVSVSFIAKRPVPMVAQTNLENLPMTIAGYSAVEDSFPESVYKELNADKHVYRHYRNAQGEQIDLYLGYYGTAKGGRTGHNPWACLPSAGAAIVQSEKTTLRQIRENRLVQVNFIQSRKNDMQTIMYYWYQTDRNIVVESGIKQNIARLVGRILHNRNDGLVIQVTSATNDINQNEANQKIALFASEILNMLPIYWPLER